MDSESQVDNKNTASLFYFALAIILCIAGSSLISIAWVGNYLEAKRISVAGALILVTGLTIFFYSLQKLISRKVIIVPETLPTNSASISQLQTQLIELESRLEHVPIALFTINPASKEVTATNGNARRLIAPGRSSNLEQLYSQLQAQVAGRRSMILFETERGLERALVAANDISLHGVQQTMVALMPVESELQLEAQNAWLKLIHVLTHEIMNSLTPVSSLSRTAQELLADSKANLNEMDFADLNTALDAIHRRARGLVEFVSSYRSLSNIPAAKPETVSINDLLGRLYALSIASWSARGGKINVSCEPSSLCAVFDPNQLEQALINLIKNAEEATAQVPQAELSIHAKLSRGNRLRIEISDNGPGVPEELIPQIFTPFFSTKERGSGIGLALVRQLIQGNGGSVRYAQRVQGGAQFIITL